MKILIVEDERIILKTMERFLKGKGHYVTTAADGKTALGLMKEDLFDLILLDLTLPFISGHELISKAKNELKLKTPIIVVSTIELKNNVKAVLDLGAAHFISKPFNLTEIENIIDSFNVDRLENKV